MDEELKKENKTSVEKEKAEEKKPVRKKSAKREDKPVESVYSYEELSKSGLFASNTLLKIAMTRLDKPKVTIAEVKNIIKEL